MSDAGFKVWNFLHSPLLAENPHVAGAVITSGLFIGGGVLYKIATSKNKSSAAALKNAEDEVLVPTENAGTRNIVEAAGEYVQGLARDIIGHDYPRYLPLLVFIFLWILVNNIIGMIPGFVSPTDNLNTTLSMGVFIFIYYNYLGFKSNGFKYLEHFTGHLHGVLLFALGWLMFPLELISHSLRPLTLGIRLRTNIFADHAVYHTIAGLVNDLGHFIGVKLGIVGEILGFVLSALVPVPIVVLGLIVCVVQAMVFTLLSTVYISIATAHEEH